ncbi:MAG: SLBB domain-containing protein [Candidatus Omnitrophica bacterium]|nr:SLBB domain-containing protein [Candidatus Omnitrophota bacterium]
MKKLSVLCLMVVVLGVMAGTAYSQEKTDAALKEKEYKVGVDDVLDISVIKPQPFSSTVTVAPDGAITFPYIGSVHVKGMSLPDIQEEIQKRLSDGYVEYPIVSVSLRQSLSRKFTIYGEVLRPGAFPVEEDMTLLDAITIGGGLTVPGSTGRAKIVHPAEGGRPQIIELNITDILNGVAEDVVISPGDKIAVSVDKFLVYGQVLRPGAFPAEQNMTLIHAITMAGGFTSPGSSGKVKLLRPAQASSKPSAEKADQLSQLWKDHKNNSDKIIKDGKFQILEADIASILKGDHQDVFVRPGDTVVVSLDKFYISGQVQRPGSYPVEETMILPHAISLAGGFVDPNTKGTVKLLRPNESGEQSAVVESDITSILEGYHQDVKVLPGDTIVVSADKFFVYGEVQRPGMYPLETSTTPLTAITMAGGFTKFGSASRVKILRLNEQYNLYDTINVDIKDVISGYSKADVVLKSGDVVVVEEGRF